MTDTFAKFYKWMTPLKNGYRSIKDDAPNEIKKEAKKASFSIFISHFGIRSLLLSLMFPVCLYQSGATFLSSNHYSLLAGKWQDRNP